MHMILPILLWMVKMVKSPPRSIYVTYCGDCGLSVRDGVATCQNCGSRDFDTHEYTLNIDFAEKLPRSKEVREFYV